MSHTKTLIKCIKELGFKVTVADIASRSGLPLATARIELNKIALEARGKLEVSKKGDILYSFSREFETAFEAKGTRLAVEKTIKTGIDIGFFVVRVSFGILLIASFVTIAVVFAVALGFILLGLEADGDLGDGHDLDMDFFDVGDLGVFFAWSVLFQHRTPDSYQGDYMGMKIDVPDRGFFYNCFSFLFGDGSPNTKKIEEQWRYVAELIRQNNGVVIGEQVLPYLISRKTGSGAMFPILVHFDGIPEVTSSGHIAYVFPSLQVTAQHPGLGELPGFLEENQWQFSKLPAERLHWIFFFAGANLCGAYALFHHMSWFEILLPYAGIIEVIMMYATFFMCFPIVRQLVNIGRNVWIESCNQKRSQYATGLQSPIMVKKIVEAKVLAPQLVVMNTEQIEYSTDKDLLEQQFEQQFGIAPDGQYMVDQPVQG